MFFKKFATTRVGANAPGQMKWDTPRRNLDVAAEKQRFLRNRLPTGSDQKPKRGRNFLHECPKAVTIRYPTSRVQKMETGQNPWARCFADVINQVFKKLKNALTCAPFLRCAPRSNFFFLRCPISCGEQCPKRICTLEGFLRFFKCFGNWAAQSPGVGK